MQALPLSLSMSICEARVYATGHVGQPGHSLHTAHKTRHNLFTRHNIAHICVYVHAVASNPAFSARPPRFPSITITLNQYSISAVTRRVRIHIAVSLLRRRRRRRQSWAFETRPYSQGNDLSVSNPAPTNKTHIPCVFCVNCRRTATQYRCTQHRRVGCIQILLSDSACVHSQNAHSQNRKPI